MSRVGAHRSYETSYSGRPARSIAQLSGEDAAFGDEPYQGWHREALHDVLAAELHQWLVVNGRDMFFDGDLWGGIAIGDDWQQRLHERPHWADTVVCLLTSAYRESAWCSAEITRQELDPARSGLSMCAILSTRSRAVVDPDGDIDDQSQFPLSDRAHAVTV